MTLRLLTFLVFLSYGPLVCLAQELQVLRSGALALGCDAPSAELRQAIEELLGPGEPALLTCTGDEPGHIKLTLRNHPDGLALIVNERTTQLAEPAPARLELRGGGLFAWHEALQPKERRTRLGHSIHRLHGSGMSVMAFGASAGALSSFAVGTRPSAWEPERRPANPRHGRADEALDLFGGLDLLPLPPLDGAGALGGHPSRLLDLALRWDQAEALFLGSGSVVVALPETGGPRLVFLGEPTSLLFDLSTAKRPKHARGGGLRSGRLFVLGGGAVLRAQRSPRLASPRSPASPVPVERELGAAADAFARALTEHFGHGNSPLTLRTVHGSFAVRWSERSQRESTGSLYDLEFDYTPLPTSSRPTPR